MKLVALDNKDDVITLRRLNSAYLADLKSGFKFWLFCLLFFTILHFLSVAFSEFLQRVGSVPTNIFPTVRQAIFLGLSSAFVIICNLAFDSGLIYSETFILDRSTNAFCVNGRRVDSMDNISVHIQDGFGPSRRAFRIVVTAREKLYVVAQTPRFTSATLYGKEYPSVATSEGMQQKHWFKQWADYTGARTGFSSEWPEYREIFALYSELKDFVATSTKQ